MIHRVQRQTELKKSILTAQKNQDINTKKAYVFLCSVKIQNWVWMKILHRIWSFVTKNDFGLKDQEFSCHASAGFVQVVDLQVWVYHDKSNQVICYSEDVDVDQD